MKTKPKQPLKPNTPITTASHKVLGFEEAPAIIAQLKKSGKKIVHCHGTFDLLHPGHVIHFEESKAMGDVLVVTMTREKYVNKGPGRPFFNDAMRLKFLSALEPVDYVIVVPHSAAVEATECVRPNIYCKGKEYKNTDGDVTGNIHDDLRAVKRVGGRVAYVGSVVFSSTKLLNKHFDVHPVAVKDFCRKLAIHCKPHDFREIVENFKTLRVLVLGDVIFDRYSTVRVQGLTSKNRILSARFHNEETQAGGTLAVFRHLKQFTPHVKIISLVGTEPWVEGALAQYVHPDEDDILRIPEFTTIVKQRFVEPLNEGKELSKLFAVNLINERHPERAIEDFVRRRIAQNLKNIDLVVAMDFGHGFFGDTVRKFVQEESPFLSLNCQTNSNNHGFNIIDKRYHRVDSFSLDETELLLACGRRYVDHASELRNLQTRLKAKYAWLTRGAIETIGYNKSGQLCGCPPLEESVVDTVGAGDAFCAVASLAAVRNLPIDLATFMGLLAGAQAVRIIGNSEPIQKAKLLKGGISQLTH